MAVFLGASSVALGIALLIQASIVPLALLLFVMINWRIALYSPDESFIQVYRRCIPGWLWFCFGLVNSLVIAGEAAFAITVLVSETRPNILQHAPLLCAFACSSAFMATYVLTRLHVTPDN